MDTILMNSPAREVLTTECITGSVGSGKTEELVKRVVALLCKGVEPRAIAVFCATPDAVELFKQRLNSALKRMGEESELPSLDDLAISTHRSYACQVLATPEAQAYTGRPPRIPLEFEHNFLLEDMKTSGIKPRRLKEMLKFFYRSFTELANLEEGWLVHAEEEQTFALLQSYLHLYQCMLEQEISSNAVVYLKDNPETLQAHSFKHVLVDDYQNISKASQVLSILTAQETLTIAGNSDESLTVFESYPYARGIEEFCEYFAGGAHTKLTESHIPLDSSATCKRLFAVASGTLSLEDAPHTFPDESALPKHRTHSEALGFAEIPDEFEGVATFVQKQLKDYEPSEIFVVAPNKNWSDHLARFIGAKDIATQTFTYGQSLKGDIRYEEKSSLLRLYTMLKLIANPGDSLSWRCWLGFGDYLTRSNIFSEIKAYAEEEGLNLVATLTKLAATEKEPDVEVSRVLFEFKQSARLAEQYKHITGVELVQSVAQEIASDAGKSLISKLPHTLHESGSAQSLVERIEADSLTPQFNHKLNAVRIGPAHSLCGFSPKVLVYSGFVNGFVPTRDYFDGTKTTLEKQEALFSACAREVATTLGKATKYFAVSYFTKAELESAELLKLKIDRIKLEDEVRVAQISPSIFMAAIVPDAENRKQKGPRLAHLQSVDSEKLARNAQEILSQPSQVKRMVGSMRGLLDTSQVYDR